MKHLIRCATVLLSFAVLLTPSSIVSAADNTTAKPRLVLMPIRVGEELQKIQTAMESALIEGLEKKYEIFAGERVRQKSKDIFSRETSAANVANRVCDGTRCLQDIAASFQAELVATATVSKDVEGYILTLTITNIFDEKTIYSKSAPCKNCGNFQIIVKLKELTGVKATEETEHNNWSIGVAVVKSEEGSGTAAKLDYDLSNWVNLPVRLRLGWSSVSGESPISNANNKIIKQEDVYYLMASYYFNQGGLHFHPFIGGGIGSKNTKQECTVGTGAGSALGCQKPGTPINAMIVAGIAYDISQTFGIELSIHNNGGENLGVYFKF